MREAEASSEERSHEAKVEGETWRLGCRRGLEGIREGSRGRLCHRCWMLNCRLDLGTYMSGDVWDSENERLEEGAEGRDGRQ